MHCIVGPVPVVRGFFREASALQWHTGLLHYKLWSEKSQRKTDFFFKVREFFTSTQGNNETCGSSLHINTCNE